MGIKDSVSAAVSVVKQVHDAKLQAELYARIIDLQNECFELQQSRDDAIRKATELEGRIKSRSKIRLHGEAYMLTDELGERPICPHCFEKSNHVVRLTGHSHSGSSECTICKTWFGGVHPPRPLPRIPSPEGIGTSEW